MIYGVPSGELSHTLALSRARNAGWVYATQLSTWNQITPDIAAEGADVAANGAAYSSVRHFAAIRTSDRYTFTATFDQSFSYHQAYIDTKAGGFSVSGIAADYLIENSGFFEYHGTGGDWNWLPPPAPTPGSSNQSVNGNTYSWWVPRSSITETATRQVAFRGGNTPSVTTSSCTIYDPALDGP
ncbi:MAG TPA: hypothetical protein VFK05_07585 [Polyangiaceae bacterium]|nr:hypothetical protein [Polyangiaceae bacterium]